MSTVAIVHKNIYMIVVATIAIAANIISTKVKINNILSSFLEHRSADDRNPA